MKRILSNPITNAVCLIVFSLFYGTVFIVSAGSQAFTEKLTYSAKSAEGFWVGWSRFLAGGHHRYIAYVMIALTVLAVLLLILRRHTYDEYHTSILVHCLVVSLALTLMTIALFYLMILADPTGIIGKFTLFVAVNWITVVLADLVYISIWCG